MYEFIEYVLWELHNSFGLVVLSGIAALAVLATAYIIFRKKHKGDRKFPWGKAVLYLMLVGYLAIVAYATILRGSGSFRSVNLHLFRAWREAWNNFSVKNWANVLLNVAMFIPLGFLLPLIRKRFRKWYVMVPAGFAVSLVIELLQLILGRGIFDVDDLFANTLGAAIGYLLVMTAVSLSGEKRYRVRHCLIYGSLTLASILAICSVFLVYGLKEYGNLPGAAAYTNDTRDVQWSLDCQLPAAGGKIAVYRTQTRTIADCDAFAKDFAESIGTQFEDISYYQEAAYYMNHGSDAHFLHVFYLDSSYEYTSYLQDNAEWADADRESVEAALARFPVMIPEYADFTVEGNGWHSFTVTQSVNGAVMIDGTLRCRYAEDGTVRAVNNTLQSYTYYNEADILTAEQAYEQLCQGKFYDGGSFEYNSPEAVSVLFCSLEYEIDTKGFYQPVYFFDIAAADGSYQAQIMIPAVK